MKDNNYKNFNLVVEKHKAADYNQFKDEIKVLLKELARRLLLWINVMKENGIKLDLGTNILVDVGYEMTKNNIKFEEIENVLGGEKLNINFNDKKMICAYYNWRSNISLIRAKGYNLPNPYSPYMEIFKKGGMVLTFNYSILEVYPWIGVRISPREEYLTAEPFWEEE